MSQVRTMTNYERSMWSLAALCVLAGLYVAWALMTRPTRGDEMIYRLSAAAAAGAADGLARELDLVPPSGGGGARLTDRAFMGAGPMDLGSTEQPWHQVYTNEVRLGPSKGVLHELYVDNDGIWRMDGKPVMLGHSEREKLAFTEEQLRELVIGTALGGFAGVVIALALLYGVASVRFARAWRRLRHYRAAQARKRDEPRGPFRDGAW